MASIKLTGDTSGEITISAPAVAGTNTLTLPAQTGTVPISNVEFVTQRKTATPLLINGDFGIWQRGTSFSITGNTYTTDRWNLLFDGTPATGGTITRQTFTVGQTDVPGNPKYYFQYSFPSVGTPSNYIRQSIEGVHNLSGKAVTGSFWAKCSSGTMSISSQFQQEFGSGGSPSSGIYGIGSTSFTATTSWQRFIITTTLGSISGKTLGTNNDDKLNFAIIFPTSSTGTISIAQAQVEEGTFDSNSMPDFQFEDRATSLARCQRYFVTTYNEGVTPGTSGSKHGAIFIYRQRDTNYAGFNFQFPVGMRTIPAQVRYAFDGTTGAGTSSTTTFTTSTNYAINGTSSIVAYGTATAADDCYQHFTCDAEL